MPTWQIYAGYLVSTSIIVTADDEAEALAKFKEGAWDDEHQLDCVWYDGGDTATPAD